jgi:hypothetical protein
MMQAISKEDLKAPCNFKPGSPEKIEILRRRVSAGVELFVAGEPHYYQANPGWGEQLAVPAPVPSPSHILESTQLEETQAEGVVVPEVAVADIAVAESRGAGREECSECGPSSRKRGYSRKSFRQRQLEARAETEKASSDLAEHRMPRLHPNELDIHATIKALEQLMQTGGAVLGAEESLAKLRRDAAISHTIREQCPAA